MEPKDERLAITLQLLFGKRTVVEFANRRTSDGGETTEEPHGLNNQLRRGEFKPPMP
jgi:hypothetical protein